MAECDLFAQLSPTIRAGFQEDFIPEYRLDELTLSHLLSVALELFILVLF